MHAEHARTLGDVAVAFAQHTLDVLEAADCDKVHVAMYSPRPGTLSARWEDDVPGDVKHARHQAVEALQERLCTARNAARIGQVTEVLIDSHNKGRWGGRNRGNTLVHVADQRDLLGSMVDVRITESSPWYLIGEVVGSPR